MERKHFIHKHYKGSTLSQRITSPKMQAEVVETIRLNMQEGVKLVGLTEDLKSFTVKEDIAKSIRSIESQARKVIAGKSSSFKVFQKEVKAARSSLEAEIEAGSQSKLKKAYLRVITAAETLNTEALDVAIENAVEKKFVSNAFRLASNEVNRAYNQEAYDQAVADPDAEAVRISLSTAENHCEECEEVAMQDNGAGPGIYAFDDVPEVPLHPHCKCHASVVYKLSGTLEKSDIEGDKMSKTLGGDDE